MSKFSTWLSDNQRAPKNLIAYMRKVAEIPGVIIGSYMTKDSMSFYIPYPGPQFDNANNLGSSLNVFISDSEPLNDKFEPAYDNTIAYIKKTIGSVCSCEDVITIDATCSIGGMRVTSVGSADKPQIEIDTGHYVFRFTSDNDLGVTALTMLNCASMVSKQQDKKTISFIDNRHKHFLK